MNELNVKTPDNVSHRVGIFYQELNKFYALSGYSVPNQTLLVGRATGIAMELPEIPTDQIHVVFSVARREHNDCGIGKLLRSWREVVRPHLCSKTKALAKPEKRVSRLSPDAEKAARRGMWAELHRQKLCPAEIVESYGLKGDKPSFEVEAEEMA